MGRGKFLFLSSIFPAPSPRFSITLLIETRFKPARNAHCRIGCELGIFEQLKEGGAQGVSVKAVAEKTNVEEPLIGENFPNFPTFLEKDHELTE